MKQGLPQLAWSKNQSCLAQGVLNSPADFSTGTRSYLTWEANL